MISINNFKDKKDFQNLNNSNFNSFQKSCHFERYLRCEQYPLKQGLFKHKLTI